jgi:hypothetical protein
MSRAKDLVELTKAAMLAVPYEVTREYWRVVDHPTKPLCPRLHIEARQIVSLVDEGTQLPQGYQASAPVRGKVVVWRSIPVLPEWRDGIEDDPWAGLLIYSTATMKRMREERC